MEFGGNAENETLQSLIRSCLLELNNIKLNLTEIDIKDKKEDFNGKINELENLILEKEKEVSLIKFQAEEDANELKEQIAEKEDIIKDKDNKIYELNYVSTSLDEIKDYFADQLNDFKQKEVGEINDKLNESYRSIAEKDALINTLTRQIDEYKIEIIKLENDVESKNKIMALEKELEIKNREINEKNNEINSIKEQTVPKDKYLFLKEELSKKDNKIRRLEEINEFFNELQEEKDSFKTYDDIPPFRLDKK